MDFKLEVVVIPVYDTYLSFNDPDGNGWLIQEVNHHVR